MFLTRLIIMRYVPTLNGGDEKEDKKKPKFEDIDISDLVGEEDIETKDFKSEIVGRKLTKRERLDKKRKIEEYLDENLPINVDPRNYVALTVATEIVI